MKWKSVLNRRSFIKRVAGFLGLAFVAPKALIPSDVAVSAVKTGKRPTFTAEIATQKALCSIKEDARKNLGEWIGMKHDEFVLEAMCKGTFPWGE